MKLKSKNNVDILKSEIEGLMSNFQTWEELSLRKNLKTEKLNIVESEHWCQRPDLKLLTETIPLPCVLQFQKLIEKVGTRKRL